jgi:glyoxylase-like metal-dependent hydrolase (beta-lactamase superfamily II)
MDNNLSRRSVIKAAMGASVISAGFARSGVAATSDTQVDNPKGLISVYRLNGLTLHSYMAPSSHAAVTTQIIETSNHLHIIDAQFGQQMANEARHYANSLGKPIASVYLSHWHPDHVLGISQFSGIPFLTTPDIADDCEKHKGTYVNRKQQFKDDTPLTLPVGELPIGEGSWDGVPVIIAQVDNCESEHALTFHFPEAGLMIVQDLMFNNAHAFPMGNHPNWIEKLESVRNTEALRLLGCGHGLPATPGAVSDSIAYLNFQKQVFGTAKDAESAIAALQTQFPSYEGQSALRFVNALYK